MLISLIDDDVNLDHLVKMVSVGFLHDKVNCFSHWKLISIWRAYLEIMQIYCFSSNFHH